MGAGRVIVIDHLEYRLAKARSFAHAETYNFAEYDDIVVEMKRATDYLGADVVIDAVGAEADGNITQHVTSAKFKLQGGSPVALNWAIDSVRKGGTVSVMGAYGPMFSAVKFGDAMNKGLTLRMNQAPVKRQWPRLFEHIQNGYLKPNDIVTHRIPLEHIAEGYHIFSAKLDDCIKPVIVPGASAGSQTRSSEPASPVGVRTSTPRIAPQCRGNVSTQGQPARTGTSPSASRKSGPANGRSNTNS
jgi:alcohol dehydrogenase